MARPRHGQSKTSLLSRFTADRTGAAAIEFALVALPFFFLLVAIVQSALVLFAAEGLQTMTSLGTRKLMTGELKGKSFADFKNALCDAAGGRSLFRCPGKLMVQVKSMTFTVFSSSTNIVWDDACFNLDSTPPSSCWAQTAADVGKQVVLVRVAYDWPFSVNPESLSHKTRIYAAAAFTNEPF
jgi:Flp pilus assembly protein TadG